MRVAVLADIHGNLPALDAVLADVEASGADAVVLNGDMATGPMPAQTLARLAGLGERAVWVRGNCERELADAWDGTLDPGLPEQARVPAEYCAAQLERAHRDLLDGLPLSVTLEVDGLGPVRFCHGTAVSDTAIVLVDSPIASYHAGFAGVTEPTVVLRRPRAGRLLFLAECLAWHLRKAWAPLTHADEHPSHRHLSRMLTSRNTSFPG